VSAGGALRGRLGTRRGFGRKVREGVELEGQRGGSAEEEDAPALRGGPRAGGGWAGCGGRGVAGP
jgi:hypothetical protein